MASLQSPQICAEDRHQLQPSTGSTDRSIRDDIGKAMINRYRIVRKMGKGSHGRVFLAHDMKNKDQHTIVAIKAVNRVDKNLERNRRLIENSRRRADANKVSVVNKATSNEIKIRREIAILRRLRHPHIVRLLEVVDDPTNKKVYIVLECMGGGEIEWRTSHQAPVQSVLQATRIVRDVMLGLRYRQLVHLQGIVHRDIKPANLLWTDDHLTVKISDFGVSIYAAATRLADHEMDENEQEFHALMNDDFLNRIAGTPAFLAPELCSSKEESTPTSSPDEPPPKYMIDNWALGVTYYCLLFGHPPWQGTTEWQIYSMIANDDFEISDTMGSDRLPTGGREPTSEFYDGAQVISMLNGLLQKDPRKRLTLQEMKQIPYLTRDIKDFGRWNKETAAQAGEYIQVTEEETEAAITTVRWRAKMSTGINRMRSKLLKGEHGTHSPPVTSAHSSSSKEFNRSQSLRPPTKRRMFGRSPVRGSPREVVVDDAPPMTLPSPVIKPISSRNEAVPSQFHLPALNGYSESRKHGTEARVLESSVPSTSTAPGYYPPGQGGVRQKMKHVGALVRTNLIRRTTGGSTPTSPAFRPSSPSRLGDGFARKSVDAFLARRELDITTRSTFDAFEKDDTRQVLSDGDFGDGSQGFDEFSSDDYGETEQEKVQRLLVGAGGIKHSDSDAASSFHKQPQSAQHPRLYTNTGGEIKSRCGEADVAQRAGSPLHRVYHRDSTEFVGISGELTDSDAEQPRHSVYSGSEESTSASEESRLAAPLEVRRRRPTVSGDDGLQPSAI